MSTMTKKKLITAISQDKGIHPNHVRNVIQSFLDAVTEALANGDRLELRDFGVLQVVMRKAKVGRNPKKPEDRIEIPKRRAVKFTPGKKMKRMIEEGS